jgi:hypothetical protein
MIKLTRALLQLKNVVATPPPSISRPLPTATMPLIQARAAPGSNNGVVRK